MIQSGWHPKRQSEDDMGEGGDPEANNGRKGDVIASRYITEQTDRNAIYHPGYMSFQNHHQFRQSSVFAVITSK